MTSIQEIPESVFQDNITRAVEEVFRTMLSLSATHEPMNTDEKKTCLSLGTSHVVSTVGFIGAINGLVYLYMNVNLASQCAAAMLGMTDEEIVEAGDEAVNDAIGELTNMTVGTFKNQLSEKGFSCKLTIPSIVRGNNFQIDSISSATRHTYRFKVAGQNLIADLLIKPASE
jgi:chemotaxis protein CheX